MPTPPEIDWLPVYPDILAGRPSRTSLESWFSGPGPVPPPVAPSAFLDDGNTVLEGTTDGGAAVTVLGGTEGLADPTALDYLDESCDDDFSGGVLDASKWGAVVAGGGSVSADQVLRIRTGSSGLSSVVVTSVPAFRSVADLRLSFTIEQDVVRRPPSASFRFFEVELNVSATTYFRIARLYDAVMGHIMRISCVIGGTTVENVVTASTASSGTMRIVRVRGRLVVWLNSSRLYDGAPFVADTDARLVFRTANDAAVGYDCSVAIDDFQVATIALFGQEPGEILRVEEDQVRFAAPAAQLPGVVSIEIYTCAGLVVRLLDAFRYVLSFEFLVLQSQTASVGLLNDRTLRNLFAGRQGFGS